MIIGRLSELCCSLYGPEGSKGLTTERSGVDGPDAAGGVVTVAPIYLARNGPLAHIPLVEEPEDEPKRRLVRRRQIREPKRRKRLAASRS